MEMFVYQCKNTLRTWRAEPHPCRPSLLIYWGFVLELKGMLNCVADHSQLYLKKGPGPAVSGSLPTKRTHTHTAGRCTELLKSLKFCCVRDVVHLLEEGCVCE